MKQKKPSKHIKPSQTAWKRAAARFRLTPEELAMAKDLVFTPLRMDEVAMGRKIKRRNPNKLPLRATTAQVKQIKHEIREYYAALFGEVPLPPVEPSRVKKSEEEAWFAGCVTKLTVTIPTELLQHVALQCVRAGLNLEEGVQAALEAGFRKAPVPTWSQESFELAGGSMKHRKQKKPTKQTAAIE